jgi:hypothetical protein
LHLLSLFFCLLCERFLNNLIVECFFFGGVGCTIATTCLQPNSTAVCKTAVSAKFVGRRRVRGYFPISSILKNKNSWMADCTSMAKHQKSLHVGCDNRFLEMETDGFSVVRLVSVYRDSNYNLPATHSKRRTQNAITR